MPDALQPNMSGCTLYIQPDALQPDSRLDRRAVSWGGEHRSLEANRSWHIGDPTLKANFSMSSIPRGSSQGPAAIGSPPASLVAARLGYRYPRPSCAIPLTNTEESAAKSYKLPWPNLDS